jgi:molecular chaperone HtpG
MSELIDTALYRFLSARSTSYAGRARDLRSSISGWLEYIPATFPHFTRHTVAHSEAVIKQLSQLLFYDDDAERAVIELSAVEAYILITAALLHDAGMVCSQAEKAAILDSGDWAQWVAASSSRTEKIEALRAFREASVPASSELRNMLADFGLRQMIAEFVRRTHHMRVVPILEQNEAALAGFAFGDASLRATIAATCESHGLASPELDDAQRFPDRRNLRDEAVNVRLMALLLRISDLLDVSPERACPLIQSAAAPLPDESVAHWNQFERFRHRLTAPDRIELDAECETADEHRLIRDWCQWIVDEVTSARTLMAGTHRHAGWTPPLASMTGSDATISVRPSPGATYIPSDWTFQLDPIAVVNRFVTDVSSEPLFFVRELIQNALDATRRRLSDLVYNGSQTRPRDIREVNEDLRAEHGVKLVLNTRARTDATSGEMEEVQELSVEDHGVGMSKQIIERYFLQIGRSYYTTPDFKVNYEFAPTSRFGIGFLSVFGASDHVTVETATAEDIASNTGGLRLTLTGPRAYILTEPGRREAPGTSITIRLATPLQQGSLTEMVTALCRRVEVPVELTDLSLDTTIFAERPDRFCWERPVPGTDDEKISVRAYPVNAPGVSGELYVVVYAARPGAESWARATWVENSYIVQHPGDPLPSLPTGAIFVNGLITASRSEVHSPLRVRLDYRRQAPSLGLARANAMPIMSDIQQDPDVISALTEILHEHLAETSLNTGPDAWRYLNRMVEAFPLERYWHERSGVVPTYKGKQRALVSMSELARRPVITVLQYVRNYASVQHGHNTKKRDIVWSSLTLADDEPLLVDWEINRCSPAVRRGIFGRRWISEIRSIPGGFLRIKWTLRDRPKTETMVSFGGTRYYLAALDDEDTVGFALHATALPDWNSAVLNRASPLVQWACSLADAAQDPGRNVTDTQIAPLGNLLSTPCTIRGYEHERLSAYVKAWTTGDLGDELHPPAIQLTDASFFPPGSVPDE